jgi:hypothetical protein
MVAGDPAGRGRAAAWYDVHRRHGETPRAENRLRPDATSVRGSGGLAIPRYGAVA